jgi:hypothetical protein
VRVENGHEVADWRCTTFFGAQWVLIDPGAETDEERRPSEDPVHEA